jgi:NADH-quinone oxidoreductase subunit L
MYFLVFHGKERYDQNPDAHHGDHHDHHDDHESHSPHESPWVVTVPLILLAIPSVVIGFMTIQPMLFGEFFKDAIFIDAEKHAGMKTLADAFHGPVAMALHSVSTAPFWLALAGVVVAWYMYLINKYYMDWINENILARGARALGNGLWKVGDRTLIDGWLVNGSWKLVGMVSNWTRKLQTGYLYHYALVMILGIFLLMTYFVWLNK